jgi:hypothetical protein
MRHLLRLRGTRPLSVMLLVSAGLLLLGSSQASAATLNVCPSGCAYTTIPGALAAASDGDTIVIGSGTYAGGFTLDKSVSLRGAGARQTTISGGDNVITIGSTSSVSISAVSISGGSGNGIFNEGDYDTPHPTLALSDSTVSGNGGWGCAGYGVGTVSHSTISGNSEGGIVGGRFVIDYSVISGNGGDGVYVGLRDAKTIRHSVISNNAARGIEAVGPQGSVEDSVISGNGGGGVSSVGYGELSLTRTTVSGNTANRGGGAYVASGADVDFVNSKVIGNTATQGGGVYDDAGGLLILDQSLVAANTATGGLGSGGRIFVASYPLLAITDSLIVGNHPDNCVGC